LLPHRIFAAQEAALDLYSARLHRARELARPARETQDRGGCLYINKLADIDMDVLEELIAAGYARVAQLYGAPEE
jgi:hypothetical protein